MSSPYIGQNFVFQVRFVDGENTPIIPDAPVTISIYSFDSNTGDRIVFVSGDLMSSAVPAETGRYVYVFSIPSTLLDGDILYAETLSEYDGSNYIIEQSVIVHSIPSQFGLRSRFIR